ncbi:MAG: hypothetical protein E7357_03525 [Clostridiales bacterium]|nr:hypothetical protein [Clostridiales bacterium]
MKKKRRTKTKIDINWFLANAVLEGFLDIYRFNDKYFLKLYKRVLDYVQAQIDPSEDAEIVDLYVVAEQESRI